MKKTAKLLAGVLALGLWSCASDEPANNGSEAQGDVYAKVTLQLPSPNGTRATTNTEDKGDVPASSTNGNEVGKDYENNINSILVVLAEKNDDGTYKFVTSTESSAILVQSQSNPTYTVTFQSEDLEKIADGKHEIYTFTYCNPSDAVKASIEALEAGAFYDATASISSDANLNVFPYANNNFLMTNALLSDAVTLPTLETLLQQNNTPNTAFPLGTVKVERVASRFDYKANKGDETLSDNQFIIKDGNSGLNAAIVEVVGMSLFNEAKDFYLLPRMANNEGEGENSAAGTTLSLCGYELPNSWVVSPNADLKTAYTAQNASALFFGKTEGGTLPKDYTYTMPTATSDTEGWEGYVEGYKIWRYATENTLPSVASMLKGLTTGVVFKTQIKAITGQAANTPAGILANAMTAKETIYAFSDGTNGSPEVAIMLGSAKDVYNYARTHKDSKIRTQFLAAVTAGKFTVNGTFVDNDIFTPTKNEDGTETEVTVTGFIENEAANGKLNADNKGFVAYTPDADGNYFCYYYYYNRHNDNGTAGNTGIMEFATVRNNIYKLSVNSIGKFGLPGDIPDDPENPDEPKDVFFRVSCRVIDWVVRVNGIDF